MAADRSYDSFIAQLERKHQVEAPGHNSYFDVFNEASRLIGHLKKGLNASVHRERQSEVRVAAQSWQDSCYNDRTDTGAGIDILDWQPRYAHLDLSEGGAAVAAAAAAATAAGAAAQRASKSAAASSPTAPNLTPQHRRSNTSPPFRRPGHATAAGGGELPSPSAAVAADRAASEPLTPSYRKGHQQYGGGCTAGPQLDAVARGCPGSPGRGFRGRRATDSLVQQTRRGSAVISKDGGKGKTGGAGPRQPPPQQQQQQQQQGADGLMDAGQEDWEGGEVLVAARERSFFGSVRQPAQQQRLLPPLDEPSGPLLQSPTSGAPGGSRADEAIRAFARTAYEPGEQRHSLLLQSPSDGGAGCGGGGGCEGCSSPHYLEPLPLAPIPRTVPKHVTEALSSMLPPAGIRGSLPSVPSNEGGGRFSREPSSSLGAAGADGVGGVGGGRQHSVSLPQAAFHPQPPEEPLSGPYPRPQGHRMRPSTTSLTGPTVGGPLAAVAAAGHGGGGGGDGTPSPLLPSRAARRVSACGPWELEAPNSPASPARARAAAAASISRPAGGSVGGAPLATHPPVGIRATEESHSGAAGVEAVGSPSPSSLIKGYACVGGGPLDYRMLDAVPRLGLDAPRVKAGVAAAGSGGAAAAGGGAGTGGGAGAAPPATADSHSHVEMRRGFHAAPAGLANVLHNPRPGAAQQSAAASAAVVGSGVGGDAPPSPGGRFTGGRRASCTGAPAPTAAAAPAATIAAGNSSGSISLGPMMITREQVDSYVATQAQGQAKALEKQGQAHTQAQQGQGQGRKESSGRARAAAGSARLGGSGTHNVIGMRGCLSDESVPQGPRTLRREVGTLEAASGGGARGV